MESGRTAFQFGIPRITAAFHSSMVGSSPSDGVTAAVGTSRLWFDQVQAISCSGGYRNTPPIVQECAPCLLAACHFVHD